MSAGENQDKSLRGLNWTCRGLEKNQNKSWSDLSEPEEMSTGKNQDKQLRGLNWTGRSLKEVDSHTVLFWELIYDLFVHR